MSWYNNNNESTFQDANQIQLGGSGGGGGGGTTTIIQNGEWWNYNNNTKWR
jgi:hypothetical protein